MNDYLIFDASVFVLGTKTGVYRVCYEIVQQLSLRNDVKVALFVRESYSDLPNKNLQEIFPKVEIINEDLFWVPPAGATLISTFHQPPSSWRGFPGILNATFIYDVLPLTNPEFFTKGLVFEVQRIVSSLDSNTSIFAISEFTKTELLKIRPDLNPNNINVMHLAAHSKFKPKDLTPEASLDPYKNTGRFNDGEKYFLAVGTIEPRKNLIGAIKSFNLVMDGGRYNNLYLAIVGGKGWANSAVYKEVSQSKFRKNIKFLGDVSDEELVGLYQGAEALVFLSHAEGFGLPIVEAMACGIPIVSSNTSSIPEVLGPAGIMVKAKDYDEASKAMKGILDNKDFKQRLAEASLRQSHNFSWELTTQKLVDALGRSEKKLLAHDREQESRKNEQIPNLVTQPLISYITVVRNAEKTIVRTLESVANQSYKRVEHIVIDGRSSDGTLEKISKFKSRLSYFVSEKDDGIYDAINKGLSVAKGDLICILNSDDWLSTDAAANICKEYENSSGRSTILCSTATVETETGTVIWEPEKVTDAAHVTCANLCHNAMYATRDVYETVGRYRTDLRIAADFDWIMRSYDMGITFKYSNAVTTHYSLGGVSSDSFKHQLECRTLLMDKFPSLTQDEATKLQDSFFHFSQGRLSPISPQPRRELLFELLARHKSDPKFVLTIATLSLLNSRNRNQEPSNRSDLFAGFRERALERIYLTLAKSPRALKLARAARRQILKFVKK